ncbi:DUF1272 domain-containing protein [Granulosicoccus sp.]|nr:DUF1272 domain-containing protein [Granulosicoccus sp.]
MLLLKPNCECCDRDLPPDSLLAMSCSFECTYCKHCTENIFKGNCPNCGGELLRRPVRPDNMLVKNPASEKRFLKNHPQCRHLHK